MVERFLRYSLEHEKKIRVVVMGENGKMKTLNIRVTQIEGERFLAIGARNARIDMATADVFSAGYVRGDDGGA